MAQTPKIMRAVEIERGHNPTDSDLQSQLVAFTEFQTEATLRFPKNYLPGARTKEVPEGFSVLFGNTICEIYGAGGIVLYRPSYRAPDRICKHLHQKLSRSTS